MPGFGQAGKASVRGFSGNGERKKAFTREFGEGIQAASSAAVGEGVDIGAGCDETSARIRKLPVLLRLHCATR